MVTLRDEAKLPLKAIGRRPRYANANFSKVHKFDRVPKSIVIIFNLKFPTPYSLLPTPYSLLPTPYSLCYT
ncbi:MULTISPECIES: hypothetical protein [Moorena]|uniref:hypothetical protein n=1 Tax=Moorena TaxID=1155738 RepID=UPI000300968E|nr:MULTISPECIES: hypothetical protein [Moorena]NEQ14016.1 hypothetical protein [Moorena sp. SIO3E2]NEP33163.1 hypothetical protein [Moorena sp. SIO3B2]NEP67404.1 hypothetical protein [Moorena sp. SIO3A5]NEQ07226.1 hypothetical protein [Moorena sp. SIO4E2]NER88953.1 hypothetical protein [Moorena sp. SIO3A2]